jgi:hypothetical protein
MSIVNNMYDRYKEQVYIEKELIFQLLMLHRRRFDVV